MLFFIPLTNFIWFTIKTVILTSIWVSVEHNYEFFLIRTVCNTFGITSRFGCVMIRYLIYAWTYTICLVMMVFAYSLISHITLSEAIYELSHGPSASLTDITPDEKKLEWVILIIMSRHLVRLRIVSMQTNGIHTFEFAKRFSLLGFMYEGYLCGFWRIVYYACFFTDFLEFMKLICRVCRAVNDKYDYCYKKTFQICLLSLGFCWAYMFIYLLPNHFVNNLLYYADEKPGAIPLCLFRINFTFLILLSAKDLPFSWSYPYVSIEMIDEIVNLEERPPKGPIFIPLLHVPTVRKRVPDACDVRMQTKEKYLGEKKRQQATVGQMIKCILTLKKKAKRIRENRNRLNEEKLKRTED